MKLATLPNGGADGRLHIVSRDLARCQPARAVETMQALLENWDEYAPVLEAQYTQVCAGEGTDFDPASACAPMPRAWQWLDGSAFESHSELMQQVFGTEPSPKGRPLMYQGVSDRFYGPSDDIPFPSEDDGIDFDGEFGVICDRVPLGVDVGQAAQHIRLIVQINDWSLRIPGQIEMRTGFGWVQAKPPCSVAPVAVTPDELGAAWHDCRVDLALNVDWNGQRFGRAEGRYMSYGFDDLLAHAARTRSLVAGTILGSGTVSNPDFRNVGSSCIAERRGIEILDQGQPKTPYMAFGDRVRMECTARNGAPIFGAIDQRIVRA